MSFMFCTVIGCDCQLIIKENYDDDDDETSCRNTYALLKYQQSHRGLFLCSPGTFRNNTHLRINKHFAAQLILKL